MIKNSAIVALETKRTEPIISDGGYWHVLNNSRKERPYHSVPLGDLDALSESLGAGQRSKARSRTLLSGRAKKQQRNIQRLMEQFKFLETRDDHAEKRPEKQKRKKNYE